MIEIENLTAEMAMAIIPEELAWVIMQREIEERTRLELKTPKKEAKKPSSQNLEEKTASIFTSKPDELSGEMPTRFSNKSYALPETGKESESINPYKASSIIPEAKYENTGEETGEKQAPQKPVILEEETIKKIIYNEMQEQAGNFFDIKNVDPRDKEKFETYRAIFKMQVYTIQLNILANGLRI